MSGKYIYIHADGRKGEAPNSWDAIKNCLGEKEANNLPELGNTIWVDNPNYKAGQPTQGAFLRSRTSREPLGRMYFYRYEEEEYKTPQANEDEVW